MLRARLSDDLKKAIRAKDRRRMSTLRLILAAVKDRDIAARGTGDAEGVSAEEILQILQKMIRQRRESIEHYEQGARLELAAQEQEEIDIINEYLPAQLDDEQVKEAARKLIAELGATSLKDMGRTMAAMKDRYAGRLDLSRASGVVKELLTTGKPRGG